MTSLARLTLIATALVLLAACEIFDPVVKNSQSLFNDGRGEEALALLDKASRDKPDRYTYRAEYFRQRDILISRWLAQAEALQQSGQLDIAGSVYKRVLSYDEANARARTGLTQIERDLRHRTLLTDAETAFKQGRYADAGDLLRRVLTENPQNREARRLQRTLEERTAKPAVTVPRLAASAQKPITIELRDVPVRTVFDVISRAIGINFVFDKDVRSDLRTSIAIQDANAEEVIRLVLATNQLEQKIVNERTILVFPRTPQKLQEHQELVVRSFYLANADVKQTANMIRTIVKTRDIFIDEKLNMLVIKDTPNAIRLAEKLVAAQDLADPEVMLEVEVLEIGRNRLLDLGMKFPDFLSASIIGPSGGAGTITLDEYHSRSNDMLRFTFNNPLLLLQLKQQDGTTNVLANPRIRVRNKGKARIHIGDRVPVITTTAAASGGFVSENVSYLDVGLKLEVEPIIHLEDEVAINVGLEVSNIVKEVRTTSSAGSGSVAYQIGTRNAATVLRLKDGETQVLAGLISDEDRRTADRVPGLGDLPVAGRLFSQTHDSRTKTEIVLLITPRLLRTLDRPEQRALEFAAGTETSAGAPGAAVPFVAPRPETKPAAKPIAPPPGAPAPSGPQPLLLTPPGLTLTPSTPSTPPTPPPAGGATPVPFGGVQTQPR
jgi:general secretion pathway protein D